MNEKFASTRKKYSYLLVFLLILLVFGAYLASNNPLNVSDLEKTLIYICPVLTLLMVGIFSYHNFLKKYIITLNEEDKKQILNRKALVEKVNSQNFFIIILLLLIRRVTQYFHVKYDILFLYYVSIFLIILIVVFAIVYINQYYKLCKKYSLPLFYNK